MGSKSFSLLYSDSRKPRSFCFVQEITEDVGEVRLEVKLVTRPFQGLMAFAGEMQEDLLTGKI